MDKKEQLIKDYIELEQSIKKLEERRNDIRQSFKILAGVAPNKTLNFGYAGVILQRAVRESLDKKRVKELLGELQYKQIITRTEYDILKVYTNKEKWQNYLKKFTK